MNEQRQRIKYIVGDFIAVALMWFIFNIIRLNDISTCFDFSKLTTFITDSTVIKGQITVPFCWVILSYYSGYYNQPLGKSRLEECITTFFTSLTGTLVIFFLVILNGLSDNENIYNKLFFALFFLSFATVYASRLCITQAAAKRIRRREWMVKSLVIAKGEKAEYMTHLLKRPIDAVAYSIEGFVDPDCPGDLTELIAEKQISVLIVSIDSNDDADLLKMLHSLYQYHLPIKIPLSNHKILTGGIKTRSITGVPLIDLASNKFSEAEKNIKYSLDKIISALLMALLSPLYVLLALQIKLSSKGPVIFKQERVGYRGKVFMMYKFRTMVENAEESGPMLSSLDDCRVTNFGHFMRKYRLDELPQFWNILKGDMSLVGPRPERKHYVDKIVQTAPWFYLLQNIRPGVTSWGMVKYGYATTIKQIIERVEYDIVYYENMSLFIDFKILIYTIRTIFMGRGI
ncbi:MAG: sugar transferase [Dysgonamonadaceae bacterium]|jgi:exopolysaccharide biosynthesis polyprenyl glycosylphosphotransferase|nr:sugar transferase [Dysgonamonadaceae bacterium]